MLLLFGAVCSVSLVLAQFGRTLVWTGQGYIFITLQYIRWAPGCIELKLEDLQKQVGKLAEEYGALGVDVTLRDGFNVPQVELVTGIKFLRVLKKKGFAPSFPEVLYFFVKKAKSIQKHLDKNRNVRDSKFRLILVEELHSPLCAVLPTRLVIACQLEVRFCYGLDWYLWPIHTMRSKRFCAEDRTFLSGGKG